MNNPGINWHKRYPYCPWGDVSIAPGCAALPARCRWTARRWRTNCARARKLRLHLKTAGRRLERGKIRRDRLFHCTRDSTQETRWSLWKRHISVLAVRWADSCPRQHSLTTIHTQTQSETLTFPRRLKTVVDIDPLYVICECCVWQQSPVSVNVIDGEFEGELLGANEGNGSVCLFEDPTWQRKREGTGDIRAPLKK